MASAAEALCFLLPDFYGKGLTKVNDFALQFKQKRGKFE
jgi:hypothetical protein